MSGMSDADVIVVGAGLAGLVATAELADAGRRVILLDQEPEASLGGQAWWSFGGLFLVDSPEQRRLRVRDSFDLAWSDWTSSAGFDRPDEDRWGREWARAYVEWAAGEKRPWLHAMGVRFFPVVGWAERGGASATGHGNSVPRFHIVWGTGPGILEPFAAPRAAGRRRRPGDDPLPPPRRRARRDGRRGDRGVRHGPRALRRRPRASRARARRSTRSASAHPASSSPPAASAATTTPSAQPGRNASARRRRR